MKALPWNRKMCELHKCLYVLKKFAKKFFFKTSLTKFYFKLQSGNKLFCYKNVTPHPPDINGFLLLYQEDVLSNIVPFILFTQQLPIKKGYPLVRNQLCSKRAVPQLDQTVSIFECQKYCM